MKLKKLNRLFKGNRRGRQEDLDRSNRCIPHSPALCGGKDRSVIETAAINTQHQSSNQTQSQAAEPDRAKSYNKHSTNSPTQEETTSVLLPEIGTVGPKHSAKPQSQSLPTIPSGSSRPPKSPQATLRKPSLNLKHSNTQRMSSQTRPLKTAGLKESMTEEQSTARMYDLIPQLEVTQLPRGGISIETIAIGRIQFGIPPETIKDSMLLGVDVPLYYIVPVERFCRDLGPTLGVNLAEFEFPAYFNFFVQKKRCTLIVDSDDAERNIRRVFEETLLGPAHFRRGENPTIFDPEDFAADFNPDAIPNFEKELRHFRVMPDQSELVIETLLNFVHFDQPFETRTHDNLGVPPPEPPGGLKSPSDEEVINEKFDRKKPSAYSRIKLSAEVAVVFPKDATQKEKDDRTCKRVEIFKIQGAEEYILHDIDENNIIIGKSRFSGNVRVSESMSVHGFGEEDIDDDDDDDGEDFGYEQKLLIPKTVQPPTFHPPSFGVTVLGNSHGFDKSGSVSGYVLWINGRGVMIDPPPYSSATLEREGIRPRTIVGIILTHCHADHDAGAFQKVLTGSPVVVITTPTIYKSFIRKYAALSNLSPALLRHSHRHKAAIIGTPLRFQGATFQFTYTLHSIPCVGFRVEWRGRTMVFTGDHFNSPPDIDKLQASGVLTEARADDLRNFPIQDADLLLHEAGVPPLHTPLEVLKKLPQTVKDRLYVVHTQALPPGCELRVAPTGTAGTIRLDEKDLNHSSFAQKKSSAISSISSSLSSRIPEKSIYEDELVLQSMWNSSEYGSYGDTSRMTMRSSLPRSSMVGKGPIEPPKVALRPTSTTDAWFTLNLLSAVPFLSGLSYASTMEVLETARVDAFCPNEVVVSASRRKEVLCVVWEGTCMERRCKYNRRSIAEDIVDNSDFLTESSSAVWHAGDWTGPISLQPEKHLSGESIFSKNHDVVAMSQQGVKAITIEFAALHRILKSGSLLYRTYLRRKKEKEMAVTDVIPPCLEGVRNCDMFLDAVRNLEILELLEYNTALRKLSAVQKRHLESLAEGPVYYAPGQRIWKSNTPVEKAFIIVCGTVSFVAKRRNAGSAAGTKKDYTDDFSSMGSSIGESMMKDATQVRLEFEGMDKGEKKGMNVDGLYNKDDDLSYDISSGDSDVSEDSTLDDPFPQNLQGSVRSGTSSMDMDYEKLSEGLKIRAENFGSATWNRRNSESSNDKSNASQDDFGNEIEAKGVPTRRFSNANRQLNRLYNRRAFTAGLVFSRGHFLGDISKMVAGLLSSNYQGKENEVDDDIGHYGFGEKNEGKPDRGLYDRMTIFEQERDRLIVHSSTLAAGKEGCVVLVFPKPSLISFLDEYPGLLLSLLGTQVVL